MRRVFPKCRRRPQVERLETRICLASEGAANFSEALATPKLPADASAMLPTNGVFSPVSATQHGVVLISETGSGSLVTEFGVGDTFDLRLSSPPTSDVYVRVSSTDTTEVVTSVDGVTFTSQNWNDPQTILLHGVEDSFDDGTTVTPISVSVDTVVSDPTFSASPQLLLVTNLPSTFARVVGRQVFYNGSHFDGNDSAATPDDDFAIAPSPETSGPLGKAALLPGEPATFVNYTNYFRGINGIMIDVQGLANATAINEDDFDFRLGHHGAVASWESAPSPLSISVRQGEGRDGADRITIIWPDKAIEKTWLRVEVKSTANTGLLSSDVHYWGNAIGETGDSSGNAFVNFIDFSATIANPHAFGTARIDDRYDHNRDGQVNFIDASAVLGNGSVATSLPLMSPPLRVQIDALLDANGYVPDFVADDPTMLISGTYTEGSGLDVSVGGRSYSLGTDWQLTSDGLGRWTLNLSDEQLPDGIHTVTAFTTLNDSVAATSLDLTVAIPAESEPSIDITSDLVSHWNFDNSLADWATDGLSDDTLIATDASFLLGGLGTHALHVGSHHRAALQLPSSLDMNATELQAYTLSMWAHQRDDAAGSQVLFEQGDLNTGLVIYLIDDVLYAGGWDHAAGWSGTWLEAGSLTAGWNHVALTFHAQTNTMVLYLDGAAKDTGYAQELPPHPPAAVTGFGSIPVWIPEYDGVELPTQQYSGWIDDVRVYQRTLTSNDVNSLALNRPRKVVSSLPIESNVPKPVFHLPTTGSTYHVPATMSSAELQTILDNLEGHDVVILDKDGHWESLVLRNTSPGPKYIIGSHLHELPEFGERVDPSYAASMPTLSTQSVDGSPLLPALNTEIGASDYHIAGIRFVKPVVNGASSGIPGDHGNASIIMLNRVPVGGDNSTLPALSPNILGSTATTYESLGGNIVFDRIIVEGDDLHTTNGLLLSAKDTAVVGSYFHRIISRLITDAQGNHVRGPNESHGIEVVDSPGRILIDNNYLSVGGIGVILGNNGGKTTDTTPIGGQIPGVVPPMEDIVVRDNLLTKDIQWVAEIEALTGTAALKNAIETKGSNRTLWEGNIIENILPGNQVHGLVVKVSNGQETDNITIRGNTIRQATGGIALSNHVDFAEPSHPSLRVGMVTIYDNQIEVSDMPPLADSDSIVRVSVDHSPSTADPIEDVIVFDNQLRRQLYAETGENGFAFVNNQLQHIENLSFVANAMDCGEFGGFVGTGLGADFVNVLGHFTDTYHLEDNLFFGCDDAHNIPPGNATFSATVELDANITEDDVLTESEAAGTVVVEGSVGGDVRIGDHVTVSVNGQSFAGVVDSGLRFAVSVPGVDLENDPDRTVGAMLVTQDNLGNVIRPTDAETYLVQQQPTVVSIDPIAGDDVIDSTEDIGPLLISGETNIGTGQQVTMSLNGELYATLVEPSGRWSIFVPATQVQSFDATEMVLVTASNTAANLFAQASRVVTYMPTHPRAAQVSITTDANDDGFLNGDELTNGMIEVQVELPGDAVAGDLLAFTAGSPRVIPLQAADIAAGHVTSTFVASSEGSTFVVTAIVTYMAGNSSETLIDFAVIDTMPPTAEITFDALTGDDVIDDSEAVRPVHLTGLILGDLGSAMSVTVSVHDTLVPATITVFDGFARWSADVDATQFLQDEDQQVVATLSVWDEAGNAASHTTSRNYTLGLTPVSALVSVAYVMASQRQMMPPDDLLSDEA